MVISDSARLLFVHVQKTGGATIDKRLREVLPDARKLTGVDRHATLADIFRAEPELRDYWIVGFVRNPWARMLSWYRMIERFDRRKARRDDPRDYNNFIEGVQDSCPDFETFVMTGTDQFRRLRVPQVRYLTTSGRRADLIGRQETLEADLRAVFARCDLPWQPPRSVNVDKSRPDYHEVYTDATRQRVQDLFARDIQVFGYRF